jgi:hypothetical protein
MFKKTRRFNLFYFNYFIVNHVGKLKIKINEVYIILLLSAAFCCALIYTDSLWCRQSQLIFYILTIYFFRPLRAILR